MTLPRAACLAWTGILMAGCAASPPPTAGGAAASVTSAAMPTLPIDGLYRGTSTRFRADRRDCPHPGLITITVQGRQFEYRWGPLLYVEATIAPDGTIAGASPDVTLNGRLEGSRIVGDVSNGACGLHFTTRREA